MRARGRRRGRGGTADSAREEGGRQPGEGVFGMSIPRFALLPVGRSWMGVAEEGSAGGLRSAGSAGALDVIEDHQLAETFF